MATLDPVDPEVARGDGEDGSEMMALRDSYERGFSKIHLSSLIQDHGFKRTVQVFLIKQDNLEPAGRYGSHEPANAVGCRSQQVESLSVDGDRRAEWAAGPAEYTAAPLVLGVGLVVGSNDRPRVDEDHRLSFFLTSSRKTSLVLSDGPAASPPGPRSCRE